MAVHELATNAVKHGALSSPNGSLSITWRIAPAPAPEQLELTWAERGGPKVEQPTWRGFGSRLIEQTIFTDLQGTVESAFDAHGFTCRIAIPVAVTK